MTESVNTRAVVLDILIEVNVNGLYSHLVIRSALNKYQYLDENERAFIARLSSGTIERQIELDYIISKFSKTPLTKMKPLILNLLRMSVYQMIHMSQVPDFAVCNEAVKIASKRGFVNLRGFVNGVLRNISRNKDTISYPDIQKNPVTALSVCYSMPEWIITKWLKEYDVSTVQNMLITFQQEKRTYIRCNRIVTNTEELKKRLEDEGVTVSRVPGFEYALEISGYHSLQELETFRKGLFQVQDLSSIAAGLAAHVQSGDYILDVCAAPGGKCIHAAESLYVANEKAGIPEDSGEVEARDLTELKTSFIMENMQRLKTPNMQVKVWDARITETELVSKVDVLLADLPCSGLGIIGRKPDIKYKMTAEKQIELVSLQRQILSVIQEYVKPGGRLLFTTCTINKEENQDNVKWFLENFDFETYNLSEQLEFLDQDGTTKKGYIQIIPGKWQMDGFFIAGFKKKEKKK